MRVMLLWVEIKERLRENHVHEKGERRKFNGRTFVRVDHRHRVWYCEGHNTTDYVVWEKWYKATYPGVLDAEGVAHIPLSNDIDSEAHET